MGKCSQHLRQRERNQACLMGDKTNVFVPLLRDDVLHGHVHLRRTLHGRHGSYAQERVPVSFPSPLALSASIQGHKALQLLDRPIDLSIYAERPMTCACQYQRAGVAVIVFVSQMNWKTGAVLLCLHSLPSGGNVL